jgi:hypothetical protein
MPIPSTRKLVTAGGDERPTAAGGAQIILFTRFEEAATTPVPPEPSTGVRGICWDVG